MALLLAVARDVTGGRSMVGVRVFFAIWLLVAICAALYFIRNRKHIFGGRGADVGVDSPAAGNLRMWMVILILLHVAVILLITMFEL
jgi:hypothetical protein